MERICKPLWRDEGQGLVEYALILALVALVVVVTLTLLGTSLSAIFAQIANTTPV